MKNICLHCFYIQIINKHKNFKYVSISKLIKKEHKKNSKLLYDVKQIKQHIPIVLYRYIEQIRIYYYNGKCANPPRYNIFKYKLRVP